MFEVLFNHFRFCKSVAYAAHPQGQEQGAAGQRAGILHRNLSGLLSSLDMDFPCSSPGPRSLPSSAALGSIPSPPRLPFLPLGIPIQPSRLKTSPPLTTTAPWITPPDLPSNNSGCCTPGWISIFENQHVRGTGGSGHTPAVSNHGLSGAPWLKGNPWRSLKWHVALAAFSGRNFKLFRPFALSR